LGKEAEQGKGNISGDLQKNWWQQTTGSVAARSGAEESRE